MPPRRKAPAIVSAALSLEEALDDRRVIAAANGLPEIHLVAPTVREAIPVARAFDAGCRAARESEEGRAFTDVLDEAAVGALRLCFRDPGDPERRLSDRYAWLLLERQHDEPTERNAARTALKLARIIDLDEFEAEAAKLAKKGKKARRATGEAAAPEDISPTRRS